MTEDKARKRAVRQRMVKTGESYTAARRHVVKSDAALVAVDASELGHSDDAVQRGSGKIWTDWFAILDSWGATQRTHTEIARYLQEEHGVSGWWAQSVAVGYERGRGMRKMHQRRDGSYSVSVSKTFQVGTLPLFEHFTDSRKRARWLESGTLRIRTSQPNKSARFDFRDDGSRVHVYLTSKNPEKTTLTVQHERLEDQDAVEKTRSFWRERLIRLSQELRPA